MKITVSILSVLVLQTSASFFDGFRGAFVTVEHSFGKLLTDVVTDVKDTIDCTIFAVEQVLSLGIYKRESDYDKKCNGEKEESDSLTDFRDASYTPPSQTHLDDGKEIVPKDLTQQIDVSLSNHDQTINDFSNDKNEAHSKLDNVKSALKNETNRFSEASALLSRELDDISTNVKYEFNKVELDQKEPTKQTILNEVKLLYDEEKKLNNSSQANEIRHVMDEVLDVLHENKNSTALSDDEEIKEILRDLEKTSNDTFKDIENKFSQWKQGEKQHLEDIKSIVENKDQDKFEEAVTDFPKTFQDVAKKIFKETSTPEPETPSQTNKDVSEEPIPVASPPENNLQPTSSTTETPPANEEPDYDDYETDDQQGGDGKLDMSLIKKMFGGAKDEDEEFHQETDKDAGNLIKQSKYASMLMNHVFNNVDQAEGLNVFDNPELLDYDGDW